MCVFRWRYIIFLARLGEGAMPPRAPVDPPLVVRPVDSKRSSVSRTSRHRGVARTLDLEGQRSRSYGQKVHACKLDCASSGQFRQCIGLCFYNVKPTYEQGGLSVQRSLTSCAFLRLVVSHFQPGSVFSALRCIIAGGVELSARPRCK